MRVVSSIGQGHRRRHPTRVELGAPAERAVLCGATTNKEDRHMTMVRWDPIREIEDMRAGLHGLLGLRPAREIERAEAFPAGWSPAVDVQETDAEYLIKADLPEVKKDDVKVELRDGVLTVEGERQQEKEEKGKRFHKIEREYGKFVRRFALPTEIDATKVQAEFKDGVLNVHLPKSPKATPKSIEVKVA
jgi:HSP20 family protein